MRWFVEISPLGASEAQKQKWCIEAAGWQPALKDARAIRGEEGPLGGFSVELLDDGARAVDPVKRLRYVIRSAPDDAPITHTKDGPVKAPEAEKPAAAAAPAAAPAPGAAATPAEEADVPVDVDAAPLPAFEVLKTREQEPSAESPLAYREQVLAVAEGTADADIERLLHARLDAVKASLSAVTAGKFVNMAVFDVAFSGKPPRPPRATLAWRDWRGAPEIRFPGRDAASPASFAAPTSLSQSVPQPSVPAPQVAAEPSAALSESAAPATIPSSAPAMTAAPAPPTSRAPSVPPPSAAPATEVSKTEPVPTPIAPTEPAPVAEKISMPPPTELSPAAEPAPAPRPVAALVVEPAPPIEPVKISTPADTSGTVRMPTPISVMPRTMPAAAPARREAFIPPVKTAEEAGERIDGDELIVELFEACADLHFHRDSLEGAEFILGLALEKLPSEVGLLSLFDINRREFVVVRQAGGPRSVVLSRLPERAGLAQAAMRKGSAIVVRDASKEPRALDDRFRALGVEQRSLMVAPVEQSGRYLGLIELCNPVDGRPFTEGDGHALTYIGQQFAGFVAERGVVIDPDLVLERHQRR